MAKNKKITKKQMKLFNDYISKLLLNYGFIKLNSFNDNSKRFILSTEKLGIVRMTLDDDNTFFYSVFSSIEYVNELSINKFPNMNNYTGKNNFYEYDYNSMVSTLYNFLIKVTQINEYKNINLGEEIIK